MAKLNFERFLIKMMMAMVVVLVMMLTIIVSGNPWQDVKTELLIIDFLSMSTDICVHLLIIIIYFRCAVFHIQSLILINVQCLRLPTAY